MQHAVNRQSFVKTGTTPRGADEGTVEVTLGTRTRRVPAIMSGVTIIARGMYGTYRTSPKRWPATIMSSVRADGTILEHANFGRDDRSGRFNKMQGIAFDEA